MATSLAVAVRNAGYNVRQVFSRTMESAERLAARVGAEAITDVAQIGEADFYIYCLKDDVLAEISNMPFDRGIHLHTSGTCGMDHFAQAGCRAYGVVYPLMTFTRNCLVDFRNVPLFVEANDAETQERIEALARQISVNVQPLTSERRARIHIAGVMANNFVNALLGMAEQELKEVGLGMDVVMPLVNETVRKAADGNVAANQTGPAVRGDVRTIEAHRELLKDKPEVRRVYEAITDYIL